MHKTDLRECPSNVCFSNLPFGVKHFQTIHQWDVDVAHGAFLQPSTGATISPTPSHICVRFSLTGRARRMQRREFIALLGGAR